MSWLPVCQGTPHLCAAVVDDHSDAVAVVQGASVHILHNPSGFSAHIDLPHTAQAVAAVDGVVDRRGEGRTPALVVLAGQEVVVVGVQAAEERGVETFALPDGFRPAPAVCVVADGRHAVVVNAAGSHVAWVPLVGGGVQVASLPGGPRGDVTAAVLAEDASAFAGDAALRRLTVLVMGGSKGDLWWVGVAPPPVADGVDGPYGVLPHVSHEAIVGLAAGLHAGVPAVFTTGACGTVAMHTAAPAAAVAVCDHALQGAPCPIPDGVAVCSPDGVLSLVAPGEARPPRVAPLDVAAAAMCPRLKGALWCVGADGALLQFSFPSEEAAGGDPAAPPNARMPDVSRVEARLQASADTHAALDACLEAVNVLALLAVACRPLLGGCHPCSSASRSLEACAAATSAPPDLPLHCTLAPHMPPVATLPGRPSPHVTLAVHAMPHLHLDGGLWAVNVVMEATVASTRRHVVRLPLCGGGGKDERRPHGLVRVVEGHVPVPPELHFRSFVVSVLLVCDAASRLEVTGVDAGDRAPSVASVALLRSTFDVLDFAVASPGDSGRPPPKYSTVVPLPYPTPPDGVVLGWPPSHWVDLVWGAHMASVSWGPHPAGGHLVQVASGVEANAVLVRGALCGRAAAVAAGAAPPPPAAVRGQQLLTAVRDARECGGGWPALSGIMGRVHEAHGGQQ